MNVRISFRALQPFIGGVKPFLEGEATPSSLDFTGLLTALTSAVTAQQIIGFMAAIVGAGISIYVAYTFGRKAVNAFLRAIKGKKPTV